MKKLLITATMLILFFSSCSQKKVESRVVIKKELICSKQYTIKRPSANVKILNVDWNIEIAKAYKEAIDEGFNFYEKQVKRNNNLCVPKIRNSNNKDNNQVE